MKRLGLLRHAKSDWDDMALRDFDRGLNDRGRRGAALMGAHIKEYGGNWDKIIASPAARVRQTLEASGLAIPVAPAQNAYLADSPTLQDLLSQFGGDASALLLAAHNPGLQELALDLVAAENRDELCSLVAGKFPTAAFAVLELDIENWQECANGCAKLVHFARPRDLDPELGPESF